MKLSMVLKNAAELEESVAGLYDWYAQIFDDIPEANAFFLTMKREELDHLNKVEFQRRIVDQNPRVFKDLPLETGEIQATIKMIEQHISEGVFEIMDALKFAIDLENSAAEIHYKTAMVQSNRDVAKLVTALTKDDKAHSEKLRNFAMNFIGRSSMFPT
jgi:rubrerythrin